MLSDASRHDLQCQARADLGRYRDAKRDIRHLERLLNEMRDRPLQSSWDTSDRVQVQGNAAESSMIVVADLSEQYRKQQQQAEQLCLELENRITSWLTGIERRVIRSHYLFSKRIEQIAVDEDYSDRHIKRILRRGLQIYGARLVENNAN